MDVGPDLGNSKQRKENAMPSFSTVPLTSVAHLNDIDLRRDVALASLHKRQAKARAERRDALNAQEKEGVATRKITFGYNPVQRKRRRMGG